MPANLCGKQELSRPFRGYSIRELVTEGRRIASANDDNTVQVWDAATGKCLITKRGHSGAVLSVAWACDGKRIDLAGKDKIVQVWQTLYE